MSCVRELFRFLVSLVNPRDMSNSEPMIQMGLALLTVALETGAAHIHNYPPVMEVAARVLNLRLMSVAVA